MFISRNEGIVVLSVMFLFYNRTRQQYSSFSATGKAIRYSSPVTIKTAAASHFYPVWRMSCALSRAGTRGRKGKQPRERLLPTATTPTLGALYYIELFLRSLMSNTLQNVLAKILLYYSSLRAKSLYFLYEISGPIVSKNNNLWFEFYSYCMFRESILIKNIEVELFYTSLSILNPKSS